jgi:hypothetical protein
VRSACFGGHCRHDRKIDVEWGTGHSQPFRSPTT